MKKVKAALIILTICCGAYFAVKDALGPKPVLAQQAATYTGIPSGFDFPANQADLLKFRDDNNEVSMRKHVWMVFAGMTQPAPGGEAIWETWYSQENAFICGASPQGLQGIQRNFINPQQLGKTIGKSNRKSKRKGKSKSKSPKPQAAGESLLSFVLFNEEAKNHIQTNKLCSRSNLNQINTNFNQSHTPTEQREITPFPNTAVAIKTAWWLVKKNDLTTMPIWDNKPQNPVDDPKGNGPRTWKRFIAVDPSRTQIPPDEKRDFPNLNIKDAHVVPLSSFYSFEITARELAAARSVLGNQVEIGDHAALIAMHVTTKEIPDWVWATFWWHDKPTDGPFAADRPQEVAGVWANYLMDTTYSSDTPKEADGSPNICFNPWLEAGFHKGVQSNCMACHQRSTWPAPPITAPAPDNRVFLPIVRGKNLRE